MTEEDFNPTTDGSSYSCSCAALCGGSVHLTPLEDDLIALTTISADGHVLSRETALELAVNLIAWATDNKDPCTVFHSPDGGLEQLSTPLPYKRALAFSTGTFPKNIKTVFAKVAQYNPGKST